MTKKAIIFDLDNTIYSAPSVGDELFASLLQLIMESGEFNSSFDAIKTDIMRKPFQVVAANHQFSDALTQKGIDFLKNLTYEGTIKPFDDYKEVSNLPVKKFLVTTGFVKLQQSKIRGMGIEQDFIEIHIVDLTTSDKTKKDVFADIIQRHDYHISDVLVIGDDLHSEIKAAQELGIDAILYDKSDLNPDNLLLPKIADFKQLNDFI